MQLRSRLVIVKGIMGSGKSTTVLRIADRLKASGVSALGITEGVSPHPIRFRSIALTDQFYRNLDIPKISIENSGREWTKYEGIIASLLMNPHETAEVP